MELIKTSSGKKNKIKMSQKEWTDLGKKAGWMKEAQIQQIDSPEGIGQAFDDFGKGVQEGARNKNQEYAQRILSGEPAESVLEGAGPIMKQKVMDLVNQQSSGGRALPPNDPSYHRIVKHYQELQHAIKTQNAPAAGQAKQNLLQMKNFLDINKVQWQSDPTLLEALSDI